MKKQRNEKPIDEELLMRMMAGEAAGTGEPGTGKGETAVPVEKAQEGKAADTRRRKGRQADYETTFFKGMDLSLIHISLNQSAFQPLCRSFIRPFIRSGIRSYIQPGIRLSIQSSGCPTV